MCRCCFGGTLVIVRGSFLVGVIMLIVGSVGVVVGVGGAIVGQRLVTDVARDAETALMLVTDGLEAGQASIELAGTAVTDLESAVATAVTASDEVADTLANSGQLIGEVARITGEDLPESIDAVDAAMPGLIRVAGLIDNTLRAARFFGADYDPDKPFDEAVADLDASLDGMPDDLRTQAALLADSTEDVAAIASTARVLSSDLGALRSELAATSQILSEYESTAAEANRLVAQLRADLDDRVALLRVFAVAFGLVFAASQIAPLWIGAQLVGGRPGPTQAAGTGEEGDGNRP